MSPISVKISSLDSGQRFDKFLRKYLPNAPLGAIFSGIRKGKIRLSGKKAEQSVKIEDGDIVDFYFSPEEMELFQKKEPLETPEIARNNGLKKSDILYEDAGIFIVNKPSGINVHPGDHKTKEVSLIELVHDYLGNQYDSLTFRPSLVHRIDRDTSGVLMIAKNKSTLESLLGLLQSGKIKKTYHAIVVGIPEMSVGTIDKKLLRIENAKDEAKVRVDIEGQKAVTHYKTVSSHADGKYTLLECTIETGRTHQIRVHLASIGHPILGDSSYGKSGENSFARREYNIMRQLLHAQSLEFQHPSTGIMTRVQAPYMDDMQHLLSF